MTQTAQALYAFFSSFSIPADVENTEPDDAAPPYITYELVEPDWRENMSFHATLWYRDTSLAAISAKISEIRTALAEGISIKTESGAVYLWRDGNFAQIQSMDGDPTSKRGYLSLIMQANTL